MQLQQTRIDTLANNLANVNTTGFRQILTSVSELSPGTPNANGASSAGVNKLRRSADSPDNWVQTRPLIMSQATDMRRGPIVSTGRETDVAIMGSGFFVLDAEGGQRYTRSGSFTIDSQKHMVTPEGLKVLGEGGPITLDGESFSIENDGTIMVDGSIAGKLKIVDFDDATKLEHQGGTLLKAPEGMEAKAVPDGEIIVAQGHLEGSNVNPIDTLVAMISAQRAFEIQQKILTTEDEMLSRSVNKLPQVS
jgi:flagellar basal-body rod protein FlgF